MSSGDFFGTITNHDKDFISFDKARDYVRNFNLSGQKEWKQFSKSKDKPDNIPVAPWNVYKNEWLSLDDFLGKRPGYKENLSFEEAKKFVKKLKLKSKKEWFEYYHENSQIIFFPKNLDLSNEYKDKWKGWKDFLGND